MLDEGQQEEEIYSELGFETGLRQSKTKNCNFPADQNTEDFLRGLARTVLRSIPETEPKDTRKLSLEDSLCQRFLETLRDERNLVCVSTDKTSKFTILPLDHYDAMMNFHLRNSCVEVSVQTLKSYQIDAYQLLHDISGQITKSEFNHVNEVIASSDIPNPKLLLKDHKTTKTNYGEDVVNFPSRFIIPCANYLAGFSKLGFRAIEHIFKKNKVNLKKTTIKNSFELIADLQDMGITENSNTVISFDVTDMYPNCRHSYIESAVRHFAAEFSEEDKKKVWEAWRIAKFGMKRVVLRNKDKYYEFRGCGKDENDPGLAIGSFESAFFSDVTMAYLFEKLDADLRKDCVFAKIYRDDALIVFRGSKADRKLERWHAEISAKVSVLMPDIKFTMSKWVNGLPFLDIWFHWDDSQNLSWKTYTKQNSVTKYLNHSSPGHTFSCTKAIPHAVIDRLAKLTKQDEQLREIRVTDHYPEHRSALLDAGLCKIDRTPIEATFGQKWDADNAKTQKIPKKHDKRTIHFVCSYIGKYLKEPIHTIIKRLRQYHDVKWLRYRMSYKRFCSVENSIQGDLRGKQDEGVVSDDYSDWKCNCGPGKKRDGECMFKGGLCRSKCVIYNFKCKICDSEYVGSTQQFVKKRLAQHCGDVKRLLLKDEKSDKFAEHFVKHRFEDLERRGMTVEDRIEQLEEMKRKGRVSDEIELIRDMVKPSLLWDGNGLVVGRSFGKDNCMLCNMEKYHLVNRRRFAQVMNQNNELYGCCRHIPRIQKLTTEEALAENGNRKP